MRNAKLFYIMGKSASGKDSVYKQILAALPLRPLVLFTTRPRREHEQEGREYCFVTPAQLDQMRADGHIIEERTYHTKLGAWTYCTSDRNIDFTQGSCIGIGTLESYAAIRDHYGAERVVPVYIEVETGERLMRAVQRERQEAEPKYAELCRRFLADEEDFSEEKLRAAGIHRRFVNDDLSRCIRAVQQYVIQCMEE